jgi:hypothetical protein
MANRKHVHVVPRDAGWAVVREGAQRASAVTARQADAIATARSLAKADKGELLIHGANGRIRARDTFGNDPCPPRDAK